MPQRILVLEDDPLFNETLEDFLDEEGYKVQCALDPYSALDLTYENRFDLYLFDVNLPYENGFDLLTKLRSSGDLTPTIFLTSREDRDSLREGFRSGADDFMKKPIDFEELLLRMEAVLRRQSRSSEVAIGSYTLDMKNRLLYHQGEQIELTTKAIDLLILFVESMGDVITSERIKEELWTASQVPSDGSIRVYITQLKKYFPDAISNIRGVGYRFEVSE